MNHSIGNGIRRGACALASLVSLALSAGQCEYSFSFLQNAGASDITVPVMLLEGKNGFTYEGFAADGSDLRVKDSSGNLLAHEIDKWDPSGHSIVWVRVPNLTKDTKILLSWGDADAASAEGSPWEGSEIVMHFTGDEPALSAPSNVQLENFGELQSCMGGPVGDARRFWGAPVNARLHASQISLSKESFDKFTASFWWKSDATTTDNQYLFQLRSKEVSNTREFTFFAYNGKMEIYSSYQEGTALGSLISKKVSIGDFAWHHYAFVYDGSKISVYKDGHLAASATQETSFEVPGAKWELTFGSSKTPAAPAYGSIDEFRLTLDAKSEEYIRTECELQSLVCVEGNEITASYPDCAVTEESQLNDFPLFIPIRSVDAGCTDFEHFLSQIKEGKVEVLSSDGVQCPCELEYAYDDGIGRAGLWAKIPSFCCDTKLKVRIKSRHYVPGVVASDSANVWNGDEYLFVNHISPVGGRMDSVRGLWFRPVSSSSPNKPNWSMYSPAINGPTGPYAAMNCCTTTVAHAQSVAIEGMALTNVFTISWWMRQDDYATATRADGAQYIAYFDPANVEKNTARSIMIGGIPGERCVYLHDGNTHHVGSGMIVPDGGWHHYAYVSDGSRLRTFLDGVETSKSSVAYDFKMPVFSDKAIALGNSARGAQVGTAGLRGALDEFRCETVVRSPEWIAASYVTQRAYVDGVGYGYAPEFADGVSAEETASGINFSAKISCRTKSRCYFCWGTSDGGDKRSEWEHTVDLGEKNGGNISANIDATEETLAIYGRFFAENTRGSDSSRTIFVRKDEVGRCHCPVKIAYLGTESLVDFPVAVSFPQGTGLPPASSTFRILDASGHSLPYEVESWNPAGTSVVWVRVPELKENLELTATWSLGGTAEAAWPNEEVWNGDYKCVRHFAQGDAGSSEAKDFNDFADGFTISLWAKANGSTPLRLASFSQNAYSINVDYAANNSISLGLNGFYLTPKSGTEGGFNATLGVEALAEKSAIACRDNDLHHYAWTSDGRWFKKYFDGVLVSSEYLPMTLGSSNPGVRKMVAAFGATVDEVRVSRKARSAAWIAAHFANMSGSMVTLGEVVRPGLKITVR